MVAEAKPADVKSVEDARKLSLQERAREPVTGGGLGLLVYMAQTGSLVSPWWSRQRDIDLDDFWKRSDALGGAMGLLTAKVVTVPLRVVPRDTSLKAHVKQADEFTIRLVEESEFGQGCITTLSKWLADWWAADNGAFLEIIGDGKPTGPIIGPAQGVAHLDSQRCTRTGDPEFPVIYRNTDGTSTKLHYTRVAFAADRPSSRVEMNGIGYCAVSRCINYAQHLTDIGVYLQEKLGSRPKRAIVIGKGIRTGLITDALRVADEEMDNRGLARFSQNPIIGDLEKDADLSILDMASLPDGFDQAISTRLGMFTISLGFGVPIRWIWPAAVSGATKADAMYQHIAGLGGGIGEILRVLSMLLGGDPRGGYHGRGKFLPPHLKLAFDFQDDEQDRMRAEISEKRAKTRAADLGSGVYTVRVARERALGDGDLTRAQFEEMELETGRMPDGSDVLSLFNSVDDVTLRLLDLGVTDPLAVGAHDPFEMLDEIDAAATAAQDVELNAASRTAKQKARQCLAALGKLKGIYQQAATTQIQAEMQQEAGGEAEESEAEKSFDFSASTGEIIGGRLARGAGGEFVNVEEMMNQIRQGILERRAARAGEGGEGGSAAAKRAENRAAVAEAAGIDLATLDAIQAMRDGGEVDASGLVARGLARVNDDGSVTLTSAGRSLLSAANAGDADRAKDALAKGKEGKSKAEAAAQRKREREAARQAKEEERRKRDQAKAAENREKAEETREKGEERAQDKEAKAEDAEARAAEKAEDLNRKAERYDKAAERYEKKADRYKDEAETAEAEAAEYERQAAAAETEAAKERLQKKVDQKKAQARRKREQEEAQRDRAEERREDAEESREDAGRAAEKGEAQAARYREQAQEAREKAEEKAAKLEEKANELEGEKSWMGRTLDTLKRLIGMKEMPSSALHVSSPTHHPTRTPLPCPVPGCKGQEAEVYADHGGLAVCVECGATFDPEVMNA